MPQAPGSELTVISVGHWPEVLVETTMSSIIIVPEYWFHLTSVTFSKPAGKVNVPVEEIVTLAPDGNTEKVGLPLTRFTFMLLSVNSVPLPTVSL